MKEDVAPDPEWVAIEEIEGKIRDFITHPRRYGALYGNKPAWHILTSGLDLIGDTRLALLSYRSMGAPEDDGANYLLTYGVLQVLYVQQDAARNIAKTFNLPYTAESKVKDIRAIRNETIGHPVNTGKASHAVSRFSISERGYHLVTYHNDGSFDIREVDLLDLVERQQKAIRQVMEEVLEALEKEDMEHKAKFRKIRLTDFFPGTNPYLVSKVGEGCYSDSPSARPVAQAAIRTIREQLADFKAELEKRGVLNESNHLRDNFRDIDYPLEELDKFLHNQQSELNGRSGYIFIFFVRHKLGEMAQLAAEIDREYGADPEAAANASSASAE